VRLLDAEKLGGCGLRHATALDDAVDLERELRLHQLLFSVGQTKIGEYVSTALGDAGWAGDFLCSFVVMSVLPFSVVAFCSSESPPDQIKFFLRSGDAGL
jgi:hypothetical protein